MQNSRWMSYFLWGAGIYNILWGGLVVLFPAFFFSLANMSQPLYPMIWQCLGMVIGVYGVGYFIAGYAPLHHWPITLVGFLGKIFGPIGFLWYLLNGAFPLSFGLMIIFNDLIWWIPFYLILKKAYLSREITLRSLPMKGQEPFLSN